MIGHWSRMVVLVVLVSTGMPPLMAEEKKTLGPEFLREYAETRGYLLGRPAKFKFARLKA